MKTITKGKIPFSIGYADYLNIGECGYAGWQGDSLKIFGLKNGFIYLMMKDI